MKTRFKLIAILATLLSTTSFAGRNVLQNTEIVVNKYGENVLKISVKNPAILDYNDKSHLIYAGSTEISSGGSSYGGSFALTRNFKIIPGHILLPLEKQQKTFDFYCKQLQNRDIKGIVSSALRELELSNDGIAELSIATPFDYEKDSMTGNITLTKEASVSYNGFRNGKYAKVDENNHIRLSHKYFAGSSSTFLKKINCFFKIRNE